MYGVGLTCRPCPEGGFCPGGNRVWPLPGWCVLFQRYLLLLLIFLVLFPLTSYCTRAHRWNYNEFTGYVTECRPQLRCAGGRFSQCNAGYRGDFCGLCEDHYYESGAECRPCEPEWMIIMLTATQVPLLLLLLLLKLLCIICANCVCAVCVPGHIGDCGCGHQPRGRLAHCVCAALIPVRVTHSSLFIALTVDLILQSHGTQQHSVGCDVPHIVRTARRCAAVLCRAGPAGGRSQFRTSGLLGSHLVCRAVWRQRRRCVVCLLF